RGQRRCARRRRRCRCRGGGRHLVGGDALADGVEGADRVVVGAAVAEAAVGPAGGGAEGGQERLGAAGGAAVDAVAADRGAAVAWIGGAAWRDGGVVGRGRGPRGWAGRGRRGRGGRSELDVRGALA